jgi:hypothetical protein
MGHRDSDPDFKPAASLSASSGPLAPPASGSAATGTVTVGELEARPFQLPITVGSPARSGHRGACAFPAWARPTSLATPVYERALRRSQVTSQRVLHVWT